MNAAEMSERYPGRYLYAVFLVFADMGQSFHAYDKLAWLGNTRSQLFQFWRSSHDFPRKGFLQKLIPRFVCLRAGCHSEPSVTLQSRTGK